MATTPFAHRNDPCPCGSGRKYKACHGKLEAAGAAHGPAARVSVEQALRSGLDAVGAHRLDEALAWFDGALAQSPANPAALHYKGYALCLKGDFAAGLPLLERGAGLDPGNADFQNRVGYLRYAANDPRGAIEALEHAIALAPQLAHAHSNLALALRETGQADRALEAARSALALMPNLAPARLNHAMVLLALGRFAEAWPDFAWRPDPRVNLRDPGPPSLPHASTLAVDAGSWVMLHGEQGLGDTLFFMRFAPLLAARGVRLRFWGDARLGPLLVRSGHVVEFRGAERAPAELDHSVLVWVGDLPQLLSTGDAFAPAARLVPEESRRQRLSARLAAAGPAPYIALTWRSGRERAGSTALSKEIAPATLGAALRGVAGTLVSVQRLLRDGEMRALESAAQASVLDLSAMNEDLDEMLALMSVVDEYVGVSNTNTHLRAGAGRPSRVLVPWPAEWRWTRGEPRSPWFPDFPLYRANAANDWSAAMDQLAVDLGGRSRA
jgi:Flp pilus assembly protein TadD